MDFFLSLVYFLLHKSLDRLVQLKKIEPNILSRNY